MKNLVKVLLSSNLSLTFLALSSHAWAANVGSASPSVGVFKMISGLAIVLAVMAVVAWAIKRFLPNISNNQQSVACVVGSVSVGSRERVVVVQVADRWIVVGVAPGQVNGLANLDVGSQQALEDVSSHKANVNLSAISETLATSFPPSFSQWLQKSTAKFINNKSGQKTNKDNK
jgi:flagellar protein FliO/FliZ